MADKKVNVLMVGTGEYTTGYVGGTAADSDKGAGVVALTMFDLRRRGKVDRVGMCGVNVRTIICGGDEDTWTFWFHWNIHWLVYLDVYMNIEYLFAAGCWLLVAGCWLY